MAGLIKGIKALFGDIEMAPYELVTEHHGYEERNYQSKNWVCTKIEGSEYDSLVEPLFRKLFNYISGKNKPNIRIEMTTPVATLIKRKSKNTEYTMSFFIPEEYQGKPPESGQKDVYIINQPNRRVLTRRFGGYISDDIMMKEAADLAKLLQNSGETNVDYTQFYIVGYDPPFKPISRRNEIWYVKTVSEVTDHTEETNNIKNITINDNEERDVDCNGN